MPVTIVKYINNVRILEVIGSEDERLVEALCKIYEQLFPQYAHYTQLMRQRVHRPLKNDKGHIVHYWLVEVNSVPAGICTFRYIPKRQCGLGHALAVLPEYRHTNVNNSKLAMYIYKESNRQLVQDALTSGKPLPYGLVAEVEHTRLMAHYEKIGAIQLPVDYVEPIFLDTDDDEPSIEFEPMMLAVLPVEKNEYDDIHKPDVLRDFALAFLVDHYGLSEDHPRVQQVIRSIKSEV